MKIRTGMKVCTGVLFLVLLAGPSLSARQTGGQQAQDDFLQSAASVLDQARTARAEGDAGAARAMLAELAGRLCSEELRDVEQAEALVDAVARLAYHCGDLALARDTWAWLVAALESRLPDDHPNLLNVQNDLAVTIDALGESEAAAELYGRVLAAKERTLPPDDPSLLAVRFNLAKIKHESGHPAEALQQFEQVLAAFERTLPPDHQKILATRLNVAACYFELGELEDALALQEAVHDGAVRTLGEDHATTLMARANLAHTLDRLGRHERALELRRDVLAQRERSLPKDHPELISSHLDVALSLLEAGKVHAAQAALEAVIASYRELAVPADYARLLSARGALAQSLSLQGDLARARFLRENTLQTLRDSLPADHPRLSMHRLNLATILFHMGDWEGSRALGEQVCASLARAFPASNPTLLTAQLNLAATRLALGDLDGALELQKYVVRGFEQAVAPDHRGLLVARGNLAVMLSRAGRGEEAQQLQREVLATTRELLPEGHPETLRAQLNLSGISFELGQLEQARELSDQILQGYAQTMPFDHPDVLSARQNALRVASASGDREQTGGHFEALADGVMSRLQRCLALSRREALEVARAEGERVDVLLVESSALPAPAAEAAFAVVETLRHVSNGSRAPSSGNDPELQQMEAAALRQRVEIHDLVAGGPTADGPVETFAAEVQARVFERDRTERAIRAHYAQQGHWALPIDVSAVASALAPGSIAVAFRRYGAHILGGEDRFLAHVVLPSGALERVELGKAGELEALVHAWRRGAGRPLGDESSPDAPSMAEAGVALSARVLDPVLAAIEDAESIDTLHVCLDDFLHLVPIDVLPVGDALLGQRLKVVNEVSFARLVLGAQERPSATELVALGGIDFGESGEPRAETPEGPGKNAGSPDTRVASHRGIGPSFAPLRGAPGEVEVVGSLFQDRFGKAPRVLGGNAATKAALRQHAPSARFLHVATHGWFGRGVVYSTWSQDPTDLPSLPFAYDPPTSLAGLAPMTLCGLALSGANRGRDPLGRVPGILTAQELTGFDLSRCELAVLSACDTNVGARLAGQGVQSLQAALHAAGVRTAITSLWRVDDEATRRWMELFYRGLWIDGLGKAEALWRAKESMRAERFPLDAWAGWVLTGAPD